MINEKFIDPAHLDQAHLDDDISALIGFRENAIYRLSEMLDRLNEKRISGYRDERDRVLWLIEEECRYIVSLTKDIDQLTRMSFNVERSEDE